MGLIKDAIKRECRKKGMSQVELAALLGMKSGNLNNQISRDETVQFSLLRNICKKLGVSIGLLLGEETTNAGSNSQHSDGEEEFEMIYEQLKTILTEADDEVVEQILGKIGREYMNLTLKKDSSSKAKRKTA